MKDGVRARYALEFKQEAVRLVHGGEKLSAVARTLGGFGAIAGQLGEGRSIGAPSRRSRQGVDRRTDGDCPTEGRAVAGAHGAPHLKKATAYFARESL